MNWKNWVTVLKSDFQNLSKRRPTVQKALVNRQGSHNNYKWRQTTYVLLNSFFLFIFRFETSTVPFTSSPSTWTVSLPNATRSIGCMVSYTLINFSVLNFAHLNCNNTLFAKIQLFVFNFRHNAAAYHQAGALRAGSPYSLPITSGTMSRFSPGGLLGHPGLSPASNGGPHLPHIKPDLDSSSSHSQSNSHRGSHHHGEKESKSNKLVRYQCFGSWHEILTGNVIPILIFFLGKKKENHIKKPLNAFMLYMKEMRPVVQAECTLKESAAINQILGRRVSSNWLAWFIIIAKDSGNRTTNSFSCWRKYFGSFVCFCSISCETFFTFWKGHFFGAGIFFNLCKIFWGEKPSCPNMFKFLGYRKISIIALGWLIKFFEYFDAMNEWKNLIFERRRRGYFHMKRAISKFFSKKFT